MATHKPPSHTLPPRTSASCDVDEITRQRIKRGQVQDEGCEVIDCTGVILCNDDIVCEWAPPQHEPERPPFLCDWPKVEAGQ